MLEARLRRRYKIPQSDGAQRDEAEVDAVQERPRGFQRTKHGRRRQKEAQKHQNQQHHEVDGRRRARVQTRALQSANRGDDQRVHEPLHAGGQHQHGEGNSQQGVEDGEGFTSVRQRRSVTITWRRSRGAANYCNMYYYYTTLLLYYRNKLGTNMWIQKGLQATFGPKELDTDH